MVDVSGVLPPLPDSKSWGATVDDLDRDGWPDLVLLRHEFSNMSDLLLHNDGGTYSIQWRLRTLDRHACTPGQFNNDGRRDLYCVAGADRPDEGPLTHNDLWLQQRDRTFMQQALEWHAGDITGRGRQTLAFDHNQDGLTDLFVGNAPDPAGPNVLLTNVGGDFTSEPFQPENGSSACATRHGPNIALCYFNAPSQVLRAAEPHELVTSGTGKWMTNWTDAKPYGPSGSFVFLSRVGLEFSDGKKVTTPRRGWDLAVGDFDGDGRRDVYVVAAGCDASTPTNPPDMVYLARGAGWELVDEPTSTGGCGNVAEAVDVDRDGRSEVLLMEGDGDTLARGPIRLLRLSQ